MSETKLVIAFDARIGNLEGQLRRINDQMRKTDAAAERTKSVVGNLGGAFARVSSGIGSLLGPLNSVAGVLGVGLGIGAAIAAFNNMAEAVGGLGEAADQVGVSIEGLQAWTAAGAEFNVTSEGMNAALGKLTRTIGEAATGNEEAAARFVSLGVAVRDSEGNVRDTEEVLADLARSISQLPSAAEQAAAAVGFFGRAGQRLLPLLIDVGQNSRDLTQNFRDAGVVISSDVSAAYDRFGDNLARFGLIVRNVISTALSPLVDFLGRVVGGINSAIEATSRAARLQGGGARPGDEDALRQQLEETRNRRAAAEADLDRRIAGRGTARELQPQRNQVFNLIQEQQRIEAELARIETQGNAQRAAAAAEAARLRAEAVGRITTQAAEAQAQAVARAAAARQGPEALQRFELQQRANERANRLIEEARRTGVTLTQEETNALRQQALATEQALSVNATRASGTSEAQRRLAADIREATSIIERLNTSSQNPTEALEANFRRTTESIALLSQNLGRLDADQRAALAGVGFETFARQAEQGAERTAKALEEAGTSADVIRERVAAAVTAFGQELVRQGALTAEQLEQLQARSAAAVARVTESTGTFQSGLRAGLGLKEGEGEIGFGESLGLGLGQEFKSTFDNLFALMDEVATKSESAGEAIKKFALNFAQAVLKIVAQAAALQALRLIFSSIFPASPSVPAGGGSPSIPFGGPRAGGGPVSSGYAYLVGERGPEIFMPSGAGRILSNSASFGGGASLTINNNAPGVVVTQDAVDERTVIASVNLARNEVTRDYRRSMMTGHGPYAETLNSAYGVRRRL